MKMKTYWLQRAMVPAAAIIISGCWANDEDGLSGNDAVSEERPVVYVERSTNDIAAPASEDGRAALDPSSPYQLNLGAKLILRDRVAVSTDTKDLLVGYFGSEYDVKDLHVSADGKTMLFAAHAAPQANESHSSWNIYEFSFVDGSIHRIITDDAVANAAHDTSPAYTLDGKIAFSSGRQEGRLRQLSVDPNGLNKNFCDEGDPRSCIKGMLAGGGEEPSSLVHIMNRDGTEITQITVGEYHDVQITPIKSSGDRELAFVRVAGGLDVSTIPGDTETETETGTGTETETETGTGTGTETESETETGTGTETETDTGTETETGTGTETETDTGTETETGTGTETETDTGTETGTGTETETDTGTETGTGTETETETGTGTETETGTGTDTELCDLTNEESRKFKVIYRDFDGYKHNDFEADVGGLDLEIVENDLGEDGKPVYAGHRYEGTDTTHGKADFDQWYRDVEGVNIRIEKSLTMHKATNSDVYTFDDSTFFEIDGLGFGNYPYEHSDHNFHFTMETHLAFDYEGGEVFSFSGDDDLWLFINGKLAINIGGVHSEIKRSINLDEKAELLGIEPGNRYSFDLFFAERHMHSSNFKFQTNINLECAVSNVKSTGKSVSYKTEEHIWPTVYNVAKVIPERERQPDYYADELNPSYLASTVNQLTGLFELDNGELVSIWQEAGSEFFGGLPLLLDSAGWPTTEASVDRSAMQSFENYVSNRGLLASESQATTQDGPAIGWYSALSPYSDGSGRWLVSWSDCLIEEGGVHAFCRSSDEDLTTAEPRYGLWVLDVSKDTRLPLIDAKPGVIYTDLAVGYRKPAAEVIEVENDTPQ